MNMMGYIKNHGNKRFSDSPFNTVDAIVLAQLSYLNFEKYPELNNEFRRIKDYANYEDISLGNMFEKKNKDLILAVSNALRYEDLEVGFARSFCDEETLTYYMSVTFKCGDKYSITYRGTDMSIIGWKEDLNMLLLDEIPSQRLGLEYAREVMDKTNGLFYLNGHSKGGNIALYAGVFLEGKYQDKIIKIFDFDGPGFKNDITLESGFLNIKNRVRKIVPQSDLVGLLLNHIEDYYIVKSNGIGILQHDLYTWQIDKDCPLLINKKKLSTIAFDKSLSTWIDSMTTEEKIKLLAIVFQIFDDAGIRNLSEFKKGSLKKIRELLKSIINIEKSDRRMIFKFIVKLIKFYIKNFFMSTTVVED